MRRLPLNVIKQLTKQHFSGKESLLPNKSNNFNLVVLRMAAGNFRWTSLFSGSLGPFPSGLYWEKSAGHQQEVGNVSELWGPF